MRCRRDLINEAKDSTKATKKEQEKKEEVEKNGNQDQVPSRWGKAESQQKSVGPTLY